MNERKRKRTRELDLRKLIKYEESLGVDVHQKDYFDTLYRRTTASFRAKIDSGGSDSKRDVVQVGSTSSAAVGSAIKGANRMMNIDRENLENGGLKRNEKMASNGGGGGLQQRNRRLGDGGVLTENNAQENRQQQQKPTTAGSSRTIATKGRDSTAPIPAVAAATTHTARSSRATEKSSSVMWIRPRSKTPHSTAGGRNSAHLHHTKMDPVQLYQYYSHEWERFKTNLPGESNRSELRWQIRHKLLGD